MLCNDSHSWAWVTCGLWWSSDPLVDLLKFLFEVFSVTTILKRLIFLVNANFEVSPLHELCRSYIKANFAGKLRLIKSTITNTVAYFGRNRSLRKVVHISLIDFLR